LTGLTGVASRYRVQIGFFNLVGLALVT